MPNKTQNPKIIVDKNIVILSKDITLYMNNLASGLYSGNYVRAEGYSINLKIIYKALSSNDSKLYIDASTLMSIAEQDKTQLCFSDKTYDKKGRILIGEIIVAKNGFQYSFLLLKKYTKKNPDTYVYNPIFTYYWRNIPYKERYKNIRKGKEKI